ncbi:MAG TPA: hypothetical protein VLA28_01925 [Afifellaceae bacterium]|nr:hypothetical protein [Afifellaceae bacterium]
MAKDSSSGHATTPRPPKTRRKGVTIDLDAEEVDKSRPRSGTAVGAAKKSPKSASTRAASSKSRPSAAASEPVKAGPLKADAVKDRATGGKTETDRAKLADEPMKSGASGDGNAKKTAPAGEPSAGKPSDLKPGPARPGQAAAPPTASKARQSAGAAQAAAPLSVASRLVAGIIGGVIALGGAVALDRLQIVSLFGARTDFSDLRTEITGVKEETDSEIADLKAQIAAFAVTGDAETDEVAALGEKIAQIGVSLGEQSARLAQAEQPQALSEFKEQLAALESAVQSGAAGPEAGLVAIEQKLAGVEKAIADNQKLAGDAAKKTLAAVKPEIDRLGASAAELAGRVKTLEDGLSGLVDPQTVAALGVRVEQLADVIEKNAAPQTVAALRSALAAESLAAAMAAGRPFAAELDILQSDAYGGPDLTAIASYAAEGLPDAATLAVEFKALIPSLMPPEPERSATREGAGVVERLLASARNVVEVREAGPGTGSELMRRTAAIMQALNGNNLKLAKTGWQGLPIEARQASADWAAKLEARLAADALAGVLRAEALARLAAAGGGKGQ